MGFIRRNIKVLFILVLPVYLFIIQNSIQNKHTHVYANGLVVTHSHPIDRDKPINSHKHSRTEICLFCSLNIGLHIVTSENIVVLKTKDVFVSYIVVNSQINYTTLQYQTALRGPPFLIS